jgi:hypothetical protein
MGDAEKKYEDAIEALRLLVKTTYDLREYRNCLADSIDWGQVVQDLRVVGDLQKQAARFAHVAWICQYERKEKSKIEETRDKYNSK